MRIFSVPLSWYINRQQINNSVVLIIIKQNITLLIKSSVYLLSRHKILHFLLWPLLNICYCLPISRKNLVAFSHRVLSFSFCTVSLVKISSSIYILSIAATHSFLKPPFSSSWGHLLANRMHVYRFICHPLLLLILNISIISFQASHVVSPSEWSPVHGCFTQTQNSIYHLPVVLSPVSIPLCADSMYDTPIKSSIPSFTVASLVLCQHTNIVYGTISYL